MTYTALVLIVDNPGLRQSQLAAAMDVERPNMVVIVDELEGRELIVRERAPTDGRAYALKATLAGRQLYEKAVAAVTAHEAPIAGCDSTPLGAMRYVASASPTYMARHFPDGVTAKAVATAPVLIFDAKDRLQQIWMSQNLSS